MNTMSLPTEGKIASLETVLSYQNDDLIFKFMENWDLTEAETRDLFEETKKWLWVSAKAIFARSNGEEAPKMLVAQSMVLMDELWHQFILFTREYRLFCKEYIGFFLNHAPTTKSEKEKGVAEATADPEAFLAKMQGILEQQYSFIYDHLGEETLVKWYSDWTEKITPDYLDTIRKNYWRN